MLITFRNVITNNIVWSEIACGRNVWEVQTTVSWERKELLKWKKKKKKKKGNETLIHFCHHVADKFFHSVNEWNLLLCFWSRSSLLPQLHHPTWNECSSRSSSILAESARYLGSKFPAVSDSITVRARYLVVYYDTQTQGRKPRMENFNKKEFIKSLSRCRDARGYKWRVRRGRKVETLDEHKTINFDNCPHLFVAAVFSHL